MSTATIRDVARAAGVSLGTVSNYLNNNKPIADATRTRIDNAIESLDFVPNSAVRVVLGGRSHVIAFFVPDGGNPFFAQIVRGIEDVALARGHVVVTCNTDGDAGREKAYAKALSEMRAHAAITIASSTSDLLLPALHRAGVKLITLGTSESSHDADTILIDDRRGGFLAMDHLLALGHRRIAYLGGPAAAPQINDRLRGVHEALQKYAVDESTLVRIDSASGTPRDRSRAAGHILALDPRPTAVVCANDMLALALEAEAIRAGIPIPDQLAIVGYDDIEGAAIAPIPLTTIHQPAYDFGRVAAELAFTEEEDRPAVFEPQLVVRQSTT